MYLIKVVDSSRDGLNSLHILLWVWSSLTLHHNIFIEVQLPLHCWICRL